MNRHIASARLLLRAFLILLWGGIGIDAPGTYLQSGTNSVSVARADAISMRRHVPRSPVRLSDAETSRVAIVERRQVDDRPAAPPPFDVGVPAVGIILPLPAGREIRRPFPHREIIATVDPARRARGPPADV